MLTKDQRLPKMAAAKRDADRRRPGAPMPRPRAKPRDYDSTSYISRPSALQMWRERPPRTRAKSLHRLFGTPLRQKARPSLAAKERIKIVATTSSHLLGKDLRQLARTLSQAVKAAPPHTYLGSMSTSASLGVIRPCCLALELVELREWDIDLYTRSKSCG